MSVYQIKTQFQNILRPISDNLVKQGATANQITVSAIVLSAGTAYVIAHAQHNPKRWFILPLSLFVRMALNAIDGMMAREHGQASNLGAMLNESGDIVSDALLINSLQPHVSTVFFVPFNTRLLISLPQQLNIVNGLSLSSELIAIISSIVTGTRTNQGPLGKSDRAVLLGMIGLLTGIGIPIYRYAQPLLLISQLLLLKTCLNRVSAMSQAGFLAMHPAPRPKLQRTNATFSVSVPTQQLDSFVSNTIHNNYHDNNAHKDNSLMLDANAVDSAPLDNTDSDSARLEDIHSQDYSQDGKSTGSAKSKKKTENLTSIVEGITTGQGAYNAYDGTAIYYRYWLARPLYNDSDKTIRVRNQSSKRPSERQVILLHRGHEHSGRLDELGTRYARAGYQVFAWDARGNGRSGGIKDHADSVTQLERDLDDFVRMVIDKTGIAIEDTLIVASSIGAVLAAAWVHDYAPTIRGMILGTPAISIRLYIPLAIPALKVARKLGFMSRVSSYVKAQVLTHDKKAQQAYNDDPLISGSISSDLLIDTHATGQRLLDDADAIVTPTFVLCAGKDYVVDKQAERQFYDNLSAPIKRWQLYPDSFHAIFHETNKADIITDCLAFSDELFNKPVSSVDLTQAHKDSASKDKVDRLAIKPLNPNFVLTRLLMQKFGHVSDAVATGLEHGFDSGSSLDKVYANEPQGSNAVGKAIDKFYLNNIGWQGIRIRREHLLELARIAINDLQNEADLQPNSKDSSKHNATIRIFDIASGNGYYVFDLLSEFESLQAELRDYDTHNVSVMAQKINQLGVNKRATVVQKDAFDANSYISASQISTQISKQASKQTDNNQTIDGFNDRFDIAIASGVFELFSDNEPVQTAIDGIYDSLNAGGYFLYTNQPWHPEQEFISKTLNNHRGSDWVMRCRSQAEMDQLVTKAGFEKVAMRIDRFGIFTVSLAKKV